MITEENKQQKSWFDFVYKICNNYVYIHIHIFLLLLHAGNNFLKVKKKVVFQSELYM